jgi:hypothetical protein
MNAQAQSGGGGMKRAELADHLISIMLKTSKNARKTDG